MITISRFNSSMQIENNKVVIKGEKVVETSTTETPIETTETEPKKKGRKKKNVI